jgi:drug/metabolite transporter (DMT)-like permease
VTERAGLGIVCALTAALVYGLIPNFSRAAFENGIPATETAFFRTAVIAVILPIIAILRAERLVLPRQAFKPFAAQALATAIISICYLGAGQFIPVGLAVIIFFTFPIIILFAAPLLEGHAPSPLSIAAALAAFVGLALAVGPQAGSLDLRGVGLAVLASLGAVMQFFSGRLVSAHLSPLVFGSLVHLVILPLLLAVAVAMNGGSMKMFSGEGISLNGYAFLGAAGLIYVFAYFIHMTSLSLAPASIVAPFYNLEPIVTAGFAAWLLGERLTGLQYAGGALVVAALIVCGFAGKARRKVAAA